MIQRIFRAVPRIVGPYLVGIVVGLLSLIVLALS